jgi:hypothetical protein
MPPRPAAAPSVPQGAFAGLLLVRALSVVWAREPWPVAAAGAAYVAAITAGATLPGLLLLALTAGRGGGGAAGGSGASEPLLYQGRAPLKAAPVPTARVVMAPGGAGAAATLEVPLAGGGSEALPLLQGRPDLRQLLGSFLTGLGDLPLAAADEAVPLQVACYAMGPEGLLSEAQLLCHELNSSKAGGGGQARRPAFLRYVQKTHNL